MEIRKYNPVSSAVSVFMLYSIISLHNAQAPQRRTQPPHKGSLRQSDKTPVVIVLDNVRSLYNVGSVFRTADAYRVEALYLCGITATPPHREIHKTALGADETVTWKHFKTAEKAVTALKRNGWKIAAVEQAEGSIALDKFQPGKNEKIAVVFGNEIGGVGNEVMNLADVCIEIPQMGTKHSLNISVSAGVVVWELWKKLRD